MHLRSRQRSLKSRSDEIEVDQFFYFFNVRCSFFLNMNPNTLYADASFIDKYKLSIDLDRKSAQNNVYFAGDCIQGK